MDIVVSIIVYMLGLLFAMTILANCGDFFEERYGALSPTKFVFLIFLWPVALVFMIIIGFFEMSGLPWLVKNIFGYYEKKRNMIFITSLAEKSDIHRSAILSAVRMSDENKEKTDLERTSESVMASIEEDPNLELTPEQWEKIKLLLDVTK